MEQSADCHSSAFLPTAKLQTLIDHLIDDGFQVVGPTVDQGAIVYDEIRSIDDLPRGWTDRQEPGHYRLERRNDDACFGFVVGPHSWKRFLFPPMAAVATADRIDAAWVMRTPTDDPPRYAFLGVRACELAAIDVQDRVFLRGPYVDPIYKKRREAMLIIAVNCTQAAPTCFCTSMQTGPRCKSGFDLALNGSSRRLSRRNRVRCRRGISGSAADLVRHSRAARGRRSRPTASYRSNHENARHDRYSQSAIGKSRASPMGGRFPALPVVHQLHHGLPDLFLLVGRRSCRFNRRSCGTPTSVGFMFQRRLQLHARRRYPQRYSQPLSPMAHAQTGVLARSIRHIGLRGLRAMHHVVPGRNRSDGRGCSDPEESACGNHVDAGKYAG